MTREPTASPVLTKWWIWELMLSTNFGSLCPKVTSFGSQNFGYQIWFLYQTVEQIIRVRHVEKIIRHLKFKYQQKVFPMARQYVWRFLTYYLTFCKLTVIVGWGNVFFCEHCVHRFTMDVWHCWYDQEYGRACLFSKSSLARLQGFYNSSICLYEIKRKNLFKSTCPTGSFTCPGRDATSYPKVLVPVKLQYSGSKLPFEYLNSWSKSLQCYLPTSI